jgi:ribosomal protein S11
MFIKKKRKKMVNTGNYIDYNKFRFYKKRKKFKYDKRYKGFRFKRGILHLKSSRSNYFITLTDLSYKTIQGVTSGKFAQSPNKKAKKSSTSIYFLLKYLFVFIKAHRINSVVIELKSKFDPVFYQCFNFLRYKRIHIHKIYLSRHLPHHKGLRKRKLRRI